MTELRWILLIAGILVITAIYFFTRNRASDDVGERDVGPNRREPVIGQQQGAVAGSNTDSSNEHPNSKHPSIGDDSQTGNARSEIVEEPIELGNPEKIVTLRVAFSADNSVPGDRLTELFKENGLRFGNLKIFHKIKTDEGRAVGPIFSVASIAEPGSFDLANIETQVIPGITLFMVLPNHVEGSQAFGAMLDFARAAKDRFGGEVLDESGSSLSIQRAGYIRDEIIDFERKRIIRKL
jgi:cell division protein ZipA